VVAGLREAGAEDVLVVAGGIIPEEDRVGLQTAGISAVFGPGSTIAEIATYLRANVRRS
jgi:methylmalonyl-CoA mutase C-terminal domain/subunit